MDRSSNQPVAAHRDMMFCHECADEWYRDERGLTCPECGSDFTEIIEENNDPRDSAHFVDQDDDDDNSMPGLEEAPPQHPQHNPWQTDDPEEGDISNVHFTQTAPGRYNVQATITRSMSPQQFRASGGIGQGAIGGFMSMLTGLAGAAARPQGQQQPPQGQGEGLFSAPNQNQSAFQEARQDNTSPQPRFRTTRFQYHGGARLYPRDANNPEPRIEPTDELNNVMAGLMAALGANPASMHLQQNAGGDFEARFGGDDGGQDHPRPMPNPLLQLFSTLGMAGGATGHMGDFVYSQEGLDRIISQLMEQTATSNAPGPATQTDIDSLPRRTVDEEMLGAEHKAECSICMDEVNIGEEVTVLPCKHWFHHPCVSAWLLEHDTCPHCRKGISHQEGGNATQAGSGQQSSNSGAHQTGSRQMPGAFDTSGSGTARDPFVVPGDAGSATSPNASSSDANAGAGGPVNEQTHRGWFGSS